MHRASESVAALASALAKAQAELVNPEKSLTATIRNGRAGEGEQTFRYAPLSSGLDIVRKTLGRHEIATVQTTAIDQAAGLVNLTTVLAHASGEWIASDWPVCPIADMAFPRRMGAALTYARRYALFTLVGIAGEDDLDAPDFQQVTLRSPQSISEASSGEGAPVRPPLRRSSNGRARAAVNIDMSVILAGDQSVALRDRLVSEIASITDVELAASWACGALAAKNSLTAGDAKLVEDTFAQQLAGLPQPVVSGEALVPDMAAIPSMSAARAIGATQASKTDVTADQPTGIDKSVLTVAAPRRYRNKEHLRFVATKACLVCGRKPSDPHHLRFTQPRALGRKVSDEFVVPLCRGHHRAVHRSGDERSWWKSVRVEPVKIARMLWRQTRQSGRKIATPEFDHERRVDTHGGVGSGRSGYGYDV